MMSNIQDMGASLKALQILEMLARQSGYVGVLEIAEKTGLSQSTVHRILAEMVDAGYVDKNEHYKKYKVGTRAAVLASYFMQSSNLVSYSRDEMVRLNQLTKETIHLLTLSDNDVIYLNKINTTHLLGLMSYIGKTNPIHCTSGGKAIVANMSDEWIRHYLATSERKRYSETTLVTEEELLQEFSWIRAHGYALDRGEHHRDVNCVSAPIFDHTGTPVASISVSAPSYRFSLEQAEALAPEVMASCAAVTKLLGGDA